MEVDCPFCPYVDYDYRYVIEHVECCHPEFGDSPFIVKHDEAMLPQKKKKDPDLADSSNAPSDEEYVECECGEVVMLSEFTSHSALHDMEETTANIAAPNMLHSRNSPSHNTEDLILNPVLDNSLYKLGYSVPRSVHRSTGRNPPHAGRHRNHRTIQDFMSVLLRSSPSHTSMEAAKTRSKAPRRLGVGTIIMLFLRLLTRGVES